MVAPKCGSGRPADVRAASLDLARHLWPWPERRANGPGACAEPHLFGFGVAGAHKIASYIAKHCGKEMQCRALEQKRYFRSRGIVVPEVDVWRVPHCTSMLRAVQTAFLAVSGHCMDGMQTWCNNNLGVVYLATAPGWSLQVDDCPF